MPIDVTCSACSKRYRLNDDFAGKRFKCKACGEILTAEASSATKTGTIKTSSADTTAQKTARPGKKSVASGKPASKSRDPQGQSSPRRKKKKRRVQKQDQILDPFTEDIEREEAAARAAANPIANDFDDLGDDFGEDVGDDYGVDYGNEYADYDSPPLPKKKKKKKKKASGPQGFKKPKKKSSGGGLPPMTFNGNRLNIALVVIGGMMLFFGFKELSLSMSSSSTPREISLAEIYADGSGGEVYLTVTGVRPASDGYVANEAYGRMSEIWYACVPENGGEQARFILYSTNAPTESDVDRLMGSSTHTGMLVTSVKGLDGETKSLLRQIVPGIDINNVMVFQEGRSPSGFLKWGGFLLGGLVLLGGGLFWIFFVHE